VDAGFPSENAITQEAHFQEKWTPVFRQKMRSLEKKERIFRKYKFVESATSIGTDVGFAT
jgi:hypothetical protein